MNEQLLYFDDVVAVKLIVDEERPTLIDIAIKYVVPKNYIGREGNEVIVTNKMGGETDWFILPYTYATAIGKKLFEQYNAGLDGFNPLEVEKLKNWLIEFDVIQSSMCY